MRFSYKRMGFVKLYTGFLIVIGLSLVGAVYSFMTANKDKEIIGSVNQKFLPYLEDLERFDLLFVQSKMYITNWVFLQYSERDKAELKKIHAEKYPVLKRDLERSVENLAQFSFDDTYKDKDSLAQIFKRFERLLQTQKEIMLLLQNFDDYQNPQKLLSAEAIIEEQILPQTDTLQVLLDSAVEINKKRTQNMAEYVKESLNVITLLVPFMSVLTLLILLLSAFYIYSAVTLPVVEVKTQLEYLSKGEVKTLATINTYELTISEMVEALRNLHAKLHLTAKFAQEIESGNFAAQFAPHSKQDQLGNSLLEMQKSLKAYAEDMESQVAERTQKILEKEQDLQIAYDELQVSEEEIKQYAEELLITNEQLEEQSKKIFKQNEKIIDSIQYAKRIQTAIIPQKEELDQAFGENYFVFFRPKDIVSGDFYYFRTIQNKMVISAIDCTGHGVSGAFMSIIGYTILNNLMSQGLVQANMILDNMHLEVRKMLKQEKSNAQVQDGMEMTLCIIDPQNSSVEYAGAMNPLFMVQNQILRTYKATKRPIGGAERGEIRHFERISFDYSENPITLYLATDGLQDQFGGEENKKFMPKRVRELFESIQHLPLTKQKIMVEKTFEDWLGNRDQIDDVLLMGIRLEKQN